MRCRFISFEKFSKVLARFEKEFCSRPEVAALIDDLGLVRGQHISLPSGSFREKYVSPAIEYNKGLCSRLYLRNRKYSRYVYPSYTNYKNLSLWED